MSTGPITAGNKSDEVVFAVTRGALFKILLALLLPGLTFCIAAVGVFFTVQLHSEEIKDIKLEQREIRRDLAEVKAKKP